MTMRVYQITAHGRDSDYYADRDHPGHTLWPHGAIITGLSRAEARVIEHALNAAARAGKLTADNSPLVER